MDGLSIGAVAKFVGEAGIYGFGWVLFVFMCYRDVRERRRYSDLVIHIITYFTKVRMVERDDEAPTIPLELFNIDSSRPSSKRRLGRSARRNDDES